MAFKSLVGATCACLAVVSFNINAAAVWLFGSGLIGLIGIASRKASI